MPAAYSLDLRTKAVAAFDNGERKTQVCRMFDISRNTLDLWLKRRSDTNSLKSCISKSLIEPVPSRQGLHHRL